MRRAIVLVFLLVTRMSQAQNAAIDKLALDTMKQWKLPGLAVAIVKDDRVTRYGIEPDINGKLTIVTSTLDSSQRTLPSR